EADKKRITVIKRSQAIGQLMKNKRGISVAGMHGKTTISLLLARIYELEGLAPTYLVGAPHSKQNPSYGYGPGDDFIAEACEYDGSFLDFSTDTALISNIEEEHLDYFSGGLTQINNEFEEFCRHISAGGQLI